MNSIIAAVATPTPYRFTVDEYHRMVDAGIFTEDSRVELLDGEIIAMAPIGSRHAASVTVQQRLFERQLGDRALVRVQQPISVLPDSEPEPDITIVAPRADFYRSGHPEPLEILLISEVADTSLTYDRDIKLLRYARANIPEAWLWDLNNRPHIYTEPGPGGYATHQVLGPGDTATPQAFPDVRIRIDDVL
jgi:Uma2 family endonuclease